MAKLLEVIVTSVEDAIEAELGGADRLELVRNLESGGLTPEFDLVREVVSRVRIPIRVMLRDAPTMLSGSAADERILQTRAENLATLPLDGFVAGFISAHGVDLGALHRLLAAVPNSRFTFHRAFDELADPLHAIERLKNLPQIDRILVGGGECDWPARKKLLVNWQAAAYPPIKLLIGAGVCESVLAGLAQTPQLEEVHVGRAARLPRAAGGAVSREAVRSLKSTLQ